MIPTDFNEKENKVTSSIKKVAEVIKLMACLRKGIMKFPSKLSFSCLRHQIPISHASLEVPVPLSIIHSAQLQIYRQEEFTQIKKAKAQAHWTMGLNTRQASVKIAVCIWEASF